MYTLREATEKEGMYFSVDLGNNQNKEDDNFNEIVGLTVGEILY